MDGVSVFASFAELDQQIARIQACANEAELDSLLRPLLRQFGVECYLFVSLYRDSGALESYRFLIGCSPIWCQRYHAKKWFAIDPCLAYAIHHSCPKALSSFQAQSPGQAELLQLGAEHGFRSGVIVPAHAGDKSRVGVLYLGSYQLPELVEPGLLQRKTLLRALAIELFEWWEQILFAETLARYRLRVLDVELLKLEQQGYTAEESGKLLNHSRRAIEGQFRRINHRLGVHHKKQAVKRAVELGILHL